MAKKWHWLTSVLEFGEHTEFISHWAAEAAKYVVVPIGTSMITAIWAAIKGWDSLWIGIASIAAFAGALLLVGAFIFIINQVRRLRNPSLTTTVIGISVKERNIAAQLVIIIGCDGHYVEAGNFVHGLVRTVFIGAKNIGNTYLSNCKVEFSAIDQEQKIPVKWLRDGPFSLNQGEERYISLASYIEPLTTGTKGAASIQLRQQADGTWFHPPVIPIAGGVVTITATSAESRPDEAICKLRVNNGKLNWEKV
jgi:hypothetical protein